MLLPAGFRVVEVNEIVTVLEMRIFVRKIFVVGHDRRGDSGMLQLLRNLGGTPGRGPRGDYRFELVLIRFARRQRCKLRVVGEFRTSDSARQTPPVGVVRACDRDPLIDRMSGAIAPGLRVRVAPELVVRSSAAGPPGR